MKGKGFRLLHVSQKGATFAPEDRGLGAFITERVVRNSRNRPSKARWMLHNGRGEAGNVHFRPLFPERLYEAVSLDTVRKACDRARMSKDRPSRHIPCIYATIGRIEIFRVSRNVHFRLPLAECLHSFFSNSSRKGRKRRKAREEAFTNG